MSFTLILLAIGFVLALDAVWLGLMKSAYASQVQRVQHSPLKVKYVYALASYICVVIGIVVFAVPLAKKSGYSTPLAALIYGGGLGLVVYGVWNFTNLAVFKDFGVTMALVDLSWGITLYTLVTFALLSLGR